MSKANIQYIVFSVLFTGLLVLFFTSGTWSGDSRKNMSQAYNATFSISEAWEVKFNNAVYDPVTKTLSLDYFEKEKAPDRSEPPIISRVTLGDSTGKNLTFKRDVLAANTAFGSRLTILNVPEDWYFVRVYVSVKKLDSQKAPTLDEFGNTITYPVETGKTETKFMGVDYRSAAIIPSITTVPATVTAIPETTSAPHAESQPMQALPEETTTPATVITTTVADTTRL